MVNANLALYQGDDWVGTVTVNQCDGTTPADITGYTAQSQIRTGPADQTWEVMAEITCRVLPPNVILMSLTSAQTTLLRQPLYYWDLQITSPAPGSQVTTIIAGQVNVQPEITRELVPDPDLLMVVGEVLR